jgi:lipoic acid synthetase
MGLGHAFITMVNRDDLDDGGAGIVAETVGAILRLSPECSVELLTSDMMGKEENIETLVGSKPAILGHNIETVRRLTPRIRSRSEYDRSLRFLRIAKELDALIVTKSSMMLGLGETKEEVLEAMDDLVDLGVEMINIGQYLQPSATNAPVVRYWEPGEFEELRAEAISRGFRHCESGPLVRSSYHADEQYESMQKETI